MQGTPVRSLAGQMPLAPKQLSLCAKSTEPARLELVLCNKKRQHNDKPMCCNEEQPLLASTGESPHAAMKTQDSPNKQKISTAVKAFDDLLFTLEITVVGRAVDTGLTCDLTDGNAVVRMIPHQQNQSIY